MPVPPLVYLGPSAPKDDVARWLPGAHVRPPARRGDLLADRMLRYSVFVLIDGAFFQENAVSPREVMEVLRDGALVIGGGSMGALRAVDCGPAGAIGVGTIYRLLARGVFSSEDDVAVTFNPAQPYPPLTDSLVNMRLALRRMVRAGRIDQTREIRLRRRCALTFFADRRWEDILSLENIDDPTLLSELSSVDVKRADANAVLRFTARSLEAKPSLKERPRKIRGPLGVWEADRTRPVDLLAGYDFKVIRSPFALWLLLRGRDFNADTRLTKLSLVKPLEPPNLGDLPLPGSLGRFKLPPAVIAELLGPPDTLSNFKAELMRFTTFSKALKSAQGLEAPIDLHRFAEQEIATALGMFDWSHLIAKTGGGTHQSQLLLGFRNDLARTKAYRAYLFSRGSSLS